jgi:hypothetical protein
MGFGKLIQRKLLAAPGSETKQQREDLGAQSDQDDDSSLLPAGLDTAVGVSSSCAGCSELSGDGRSMHSSSGSSSSGASSECDREDEVRSSVACRTAISSITVDVSTPKRAVGHRSCCPVVAKSCCALDKAGMAVSRTKSTGSMHQSVLQLFKLLAAGVL